MIAIIYIKTKLVLKILKIQDVWISLLQSKSKEIVNRNYMKFDRDVFQGELKLKLQSIDNNEHFETVHPKFVG